MRLLITTLALLASGAQAQELWQGVTYGMTPEQVRALYPASEAKNPPKPGALRLVTPGVDIFGQACTGAFYFPDSLKAESVTVNCVVPGRKVDSGAFHGQLLRALRAKYGAETGTENTRFVESSSWLTPLISVDLVAVFNDQSTSFSVIYRSRAGTAGGAKL